MLWRMLRQLGAQFTPQSAGDNHRFSGLQPDLGAAGGVH